MNKTPLPTVSSFSAFYPAPPRLHWAILLIFILAGEGLSLKLPLPYKEIAVNLVIAAWPLYLCVWLRRLDTRSLALYWALASLATGFLFSWLLWLVVIFEVREDLLDHYNRREPVGLRLNLVLTALFSFVYFQYHLRRIARLKQAAMDATPHVVRAATSD